jgi:hypothetical protein
MVRWSFSRTGFRIKSDNILAPLAVNCAKVLAQISVPEMPLEQLVSQEPTEAPASAERPVRRRARTPAPIEHAVRWKAYIDKMRRACPLCAHRDHEESSEDDKETEEQILLFSPIVFSRDIGNVLHLSSFIQLRFLCQRMFTPSVLVDDQERRL